MSAWNTIKQRRHSESAVPMLFVFIDQYHLQDNLFETKLLMIGHIDSGMTNIIERLCSCTLTVIHAQTAGSGSCK